MGDSLWVYYLLM